MKCNYHAHTFRCRHARGTERQYVELAIKQGLEVFGFADHSPYIFDDGHVSRMRMTPDEVPSYVVTLEELEKEYGKYIKIYIGYEAEYFPALFGNTCKEIYDRYRTDYLILGQHYLGNEYGRVCMRTSEKNGREDLVTYVRTVTEAMRTGKFFYIAHPDVLRFEEDWDFYREQMGILCKEAKRLGVPLEFNVLGYSTNRHYPSEEFFKIAAKTGNDVILGIDAHDPEDIEKAEWIEKAEKLLDSLGCNVVQPKEPVFYRKG